MSERMETSEAIEIEELIKAALQREPPAKPTIFKAPKSARWTDRHAYEPKLVSIGPYHRAKSNDDFKAMEELKWRLLGHYLSRTEYNSDWFLRKMKDSEKKARGYYSEVIDIKSDEFVKMLLLDGCFLVQIISFFVTPTEQRPQELRQLLEGNMWFGNLLFRDLLLLENQLPYFIVKDLLDALGIQEPDAIFTALELFNCFLPNKLKTRASEALFEVQKVHHLLHFLHEWILIDLKKKRKPSSGGHCSALSSLTNKTKDQLFKSIPSCSGASDPQEEESISLFTETKHRSSGKDSLKPLPSIPSVIGLRKAGVEVKKTEEEDNFLNISFRNGVLTIPALKVDDDTSLILRNLIAFEQCYLCTGIPVTNYALFMNNIVITPRDVELLCEMRIIERKLANDEEIPGLFNKMCDGVVCDVEGNHLEQMSEDVKKYCGSRWRRWRARLMHDSSRNPWAIISAASGAVLLILTILQTLYSALSYYEW